jgi:myosin heavy subunit
MSLLDEECRLGNATDDTLINKMHQNLVKHPNYQAPKREKTKFLVNHYAGEVSYEITGFLEKNRDSLSEDLIELGKSSTIEFIQKLFKEDVPGQVKKTVGAQFREQVNSLMNTLAATSPHYVRCIKPNGEKTPNTFTDELILQQLRFSGMLDTIRIRKAGFPIRYAAEDFYTRYKILAPKVLLDKKDARVSGKGILNEAKLDTDSWRVGITKIFLREELHNKMEDMRKSKLNYYASFIQRFYLSSKLRKKHQKQITAAVVLESVIRRKIAQSYFNSFRRAAANTQASKRAR